MSGKSEEIEPINPADLACGYDRLRFPKPVAIGDNEGTKKKATRTQLEFDDLIAIVGHAGA